MTDFGVTGERYGGYGSMAELDDAVEALKARGIKAKNDFSGWCRSTGDEHWHPRFITVTGLTPQQAAKLLGKPQFEKVIGGWAFSVGDRRFMAQRNEAGFAGRDWELLEYIGADELHRQMQFVEDMLPSRAACMERAKEVCA